MRLLTIPISHYCERARWALEHVGLDYEEEQHLQMFHYRPVRRSGGGKSVPVLVTDDGRVLDDSSDIVRFADGQAPGDRRLYPDDPSARDAVLAIERAHAEPLGVESRRIMYDHFFRWGRLALGFNGGQAPRHERVLAWIAFPFFERYARGYLEVNPSSVSTALERVRRILDDVETRLADGRPFLAGDRFTAADLTFACMAAPLVSPEPYGTPLPLPSEVPESTRRLLDEFRTHPAGAFSLRMFAEHRPKPSSLRRPHPAA